MWFPVTLLLLGMSLTLLFQEKRVSPNLSLSSIALADEVNAITVNPILVQNPPTRDIRISALHRFLQEINSPLLNHAEDLVTVADTYGLDYALLPAIAMQESGGCRTIPENSHNCWGYGIYGSKVTRFSSYPEAFDRVAKTIKETYIKSGLTNPTLLENKWTPKSSGSWSYSVNFFMSKIHQYEQQTPAS